MRPGCPPRDATIHAPVGCPCERAHLAARPPHILSNPTGAIAPAKNMDPANMTRTKLALFSGAALLALSLASPASAAPTGSYQQSCRDIEQQRGRSLTAECRTRDGSWVETRLDDSDCSGDIANVNGRLVCNDNDRRADRNDRSGDDRSEGDGAWNHRGDNDHQTYRGDTRPDTYGERDERRYSGDDVMSRPQLIRRMDRQGYRNARDLRPIRNSDDWRALATWHGRAVAVRLDPQSGRVISARYL